MRFLLSMLALLALAACSAEPVERDTLVLTYASPYPATHPFSRADITWMEYVERESGGKVRIRPYWGGSLLSSNENMVEIRHGIADIGMITPMYSRAAHLQRSQPSFYSGIGSVQDQIAVYKCLANSFSAFNEDVKGLHILAIQGGNYPGILTRDRPVRSLADLRGLRLRAQEDTAAVLEQLGADPVNMSMAEVYPAMAKGVIDGVVTPPDAMRSMSLAEVGNYFSTLKISRGAYPARAMSEHVWERLTPEQQALFTRAQPVWEEAMNAQLIKALVAGTKFAQEQKVEFVSVSPADQARFDALYRDNAVRLSRRLNRFDIDGEPIARRATALIADRAAGRPLDCQRAAK